MENKQLIESSSLFLDVSKMTLNKIDLFLSNTNLDKTQKANLIKLFEELYGEGFTDGIAS